MKVLMIGYDSTNYPDRSLEVKIAEQIAKHVDEVVMLIEREPKYNLPFKKPDNLSFIITDLSKETSPKMPEILKTNPDIIFGSSIGALPFAVSLAKKFKVKSVCQILDVPYWRMNSVFDKINPDWKRMYNISFSYLKEADRIISHTTLTRDLIKKLINRDSDVIYYGLDDVEADLVPEQEKTNDIVFVSRHVFYKGVSFVYYVADMLKREGYNVSIIMVGPNSKEILRNLEISSLLYLNVAHKIRCSNKEKWEIIKKSKVAIYPDYNEWSGGIFPGEAMYCKVPVVCWDLPIRREQFDKYPFYVNKFDIRAMVDAIKPLLKVKDGKRLEEGHKFIKENRTFDATGKQIVDILKEELNKK